jgi:uncharacterized membrane protein YhaH (DUF805 family)
MFKNVFSFKGRIRRMEYALTQIFYGICLYSIEAFSQPEGREFFSLLLLVPIYILIAQSAKRCHDRGSSAWFMLIPLYGLVLSFFPGEHGPNEYGDNPKGYGNDKEVFVNSEESFR